MKGETENVESAKKLQNNNFLDIKNKNIQKLHMRLVLCYVCLVFSCTKCKRLFSINLYKVCT